MTEQEQLQYCQRKFNELLRTFKEAGVSAKCEYESICILAAATIEAVPPHLRQHLIGLLNQWERHSPAPPRDTGGYIGDLAKEVLRAEGRVSVYEWIVERCKRIAARSALIGDESTRDKFERFAGHVVKRARRDNDELVATLVAFKSYEAGG